MVCHEPYCQLRTGGDEDRQVGLSIHCSFVCHSESGKTTENVRNLPVSLRKGAVQLLNRRVCGCRGFAGDRV